LLIDEESISDANLILTLVLMDMPVDAFAGDTDDIMGGSPGPSILKRDAGEKAFV
jgi:hypothetical protein